MRNGIARAIAIARHDRQRVIDLTTADPSATTHDELAQIAARALANLALALETIAAIDNAPMTRPFDTSRGYDASAVEFAIMNCAHRLRDS